METAHIYIYGDIGSWQAKDAADWGEVTLSDVRNQYEAQKDAENIKLHIHSPGGYVTEGFAIHDYIRSLGKPVTTIIEGMCYSIATVIALAGDTRQMTSNSDFMIHNPWGGAWGESSEIQKYADDLKKLEQKVADFYAEKTKITAEEALELMKAETFMTPEQSLEKGFITEIATVMKAVAKYKPNTNKMSKKKNSQDETKGKLAKMLEKIGNFIDGSPEMKMVTDANGVEIDFTELEEDDTPAVGDVATIDGAAAEGEHVMPNGETFVFTAGALTEIKPDESVDDTADMEALQAENAQLKKDLKAEKKAFKTLQAANKKSEADSAKAMELIKEMKTEIKAIKKSVSSDFEVEEKDRKDPKNSKKTREVFKKKE